MLSFHYERPAVSSASMKAQILSLDILFKYFIPYFYFQFLVLRPNTPQRRTLMRLEARGG